MNRTAKQMRVNISLSLCVYHTDCTDSISWREIENDPLYRGIHSDDKYKTLK